MSERTTVIVSALAALAILGLGVTAQQTGGRLENRAEALESDLRFQLEMTWRHDGRVREARLATLEETLTAWRQSPRTAADRKLLEEWLQRSIVSSLPGESGALPPTPAFGSASVNANGSTAAVDSRVEEIAPPGSATSALPRDVELRPGQAYTPPRAKEIHLTPRARAGAGAQAVVPPPRRVMAAKPVTPVEDAAVAEESAPVAEAGAIELADVAEAPSRTEEIERSAPTVAEVGESYQESEVLQGEVAEGEIARGTAGAGRPGSLEGDVAAEAVEAKEPVMVNLAELNAQIRGYHGGLDEITAIVVRGRGKLNLGQVAKLVGELELLAGQHQFVRLYYDGLSDRERRFVNEPRSMAETIELVDGQRAALVEEEGDFLTTLEADAEEDELQRRLKAIAAAVGESAEKNVEAEDGGQQ